MRYPEVERRSGTRRRSVSWFQPNLLIRMLMVVLIPAWVSIGLALIWLSQRPDAWWPVVVILALQLPVDLAASFAVGCSLYQQYRRAQRR